RQLFSLQRSGCWLTSSMPRDRKSTRLNSSHSQISYAVFCLKKKKKKKKKIIKKKKKKKNKNKKTQTHSFNYSTTNKKTIYIYKKRYITRIELSTMTLTEDLL